MPVKSNNDSRSVVLMVTLQGMGHAEPELRLKLLRSYLTLLDADGRLPAAICFVTEGVRLVVEGSPLLDILAQLEARGVYLISCSTCLGAFGLTDQVKVGIIGGMPDIIEAQWQADKVISL
jgi:hypothetical protein